MTADDGPTITFGDSAKETVIEQFGLITDADGYLIRHPDPPETAEPDRIPDDAFYPEDTDHEHAGRLKAHGGDPITLQEFGGFGQTTDGDAVAIRNNFVAISDYVSDPETESYSGNADA